MSPGSDRRKTLTAAASRRVRGDPGRRRTLDLEASEASPGSGRRKTLTFATDCPTAGGAALQWKRRSLRVRA